MMVLLHLITFSGFKLRLTLTSISILVLIFSSLPPISIQEVTGTLVAIYLLNYLQALTSEPSLEIELGPGLVFLSQRRQSSGKDGGTSSAFVE